MKTDLASLTLVRAATVAEACARVEEGYRPLAGGTDVMVLLSAGKLPSARWVDVSRLGELRGIEVRPDVIALGALTTYTELQRHPVVVAELPALVQAAAVTGSVAIQNRGTLGGNVANASPAADSSPALLAYGAQIELVSRAGRRTLPYDEFHLAYRRTAALPGELVARLLLPRGEDRAHYYRKVGPRQAQAISKVCLAACADRAAGQVTAVRIALGGVAAVPVRARAAERAALAREPLARVIEALGEAISPIDDVRSTARYRLRVAGNLLGEFLAHAGLAR